jgi:chitodextrinase
MNEVHGAGYTSEVYPYLTNGDTTDWTYGIFRMPSITIELRPTGSSGGSGFELPEDEIIPTCEENLPAALYLIKWNEADLNSDNIVNLQDLAILSSYWLWPGDCNLDNICCNGADIFGSNTVDMIDLAVFAGEWQAKSLIDSSAPSYDEPWDFSSHPAATGDSSIIMTAKPATDISGVEYYFTCTAGGGNNSSWQDSRTYEDTGLSPLTEYTYTVTARDKSANHNQTAASDPCSVTTDPPDTTPPIPSPMTWETAPNARSGSVISMTATTASDSSGVQYFFDCITAGGHDSGWQDSRTYEDTGLLPVTEYTYTVTARDKSVAHNPTAASDPASATTSHEDNVVLPANGGNLDSFTSEYGSGWVASDLTNEVTNEDGWSSEKNPKPYQEFIYSFRDGKDATLDLAVIHGGTAEGSYYSKDVEVWTSADGTSFTSAGSDTLLDQANDSVTIDLGSVVAKKVKLRIESGYEPDYWELAEFVVYGEVID